MAAPATSGSISFIIAARDEATRLWRTVDVLLTAAPKQFERWELIIVDNGSTDDTGPVADGLAAEFPCVRVLHYREPLGLGGAFKAGLPLATMDYVSVAHGDGGTSAGELIKIWEQRGRADLVVPYLLNEEQRPVLRLYLSYGFRTLVNTLFGIRVRYHMHFVLYRRELIQSVRLRTNSHAFQAEVLVKLLRRGHSFVEVGVNDDFEGQAPTRSYRWRNVVQVALFFLWTFYDVYIAREQPEPVPPFSDAA